MINCNECGKEIDEIVECHQCGAFCIPCYEKRSDEWFVMDHINHCRDLCPEHAHLASQWS